MTRDGYAECRAEYDVRGNKTAVRYFGMDGKPCLQKDGDAGWIAEYDSRGREVRRFWIDVNGKPTPGKDGYADAAGSTTLVVTRRRFDFMAWMGSRVCIRTAMQNTIMNTMRAETGRRRDALGRMGSRA